MPFWDILQQAPSSPSALPSGTAGSRPFWEQLGSRNATQTTPDIAEEMEEPDAPSNPLVFAVGMVKNAVMDVPEILGGLTALGSKVVEDVVGGAQMLIPGTQGTEAKIQEQGFNTANMVRMFDDAMAADYGNRYGAAGLEEMRDQIYANPLTYVMDAFMLGGAAASGVKIGGRLGIVSEGLSTKIRGISPAQEVMGGLRPAKGIINTRGGGMIADEAVNAFGLTAQGVMPEAGLTTLGLSVNPAKRFIQNKVIDRLLTRSGDEVLRLAEEGQWRKLGISESNLGAQAQLRERAGRALESVRVMRPQAEKFFAHRAARIIAGVSKQDFFAARNNMVSSLRHALGVPENEKGGANWAQVQELMGTGKEFQAKLYGQALHLSYPERGPYLVNHGDIPVMAPNDPILSLVGINPEGRLKVMESIQNYFRDSTGAQGGVSTVFTPLHTPHSTLYNGQTGAMRFSALVGNINDAPTEVLRWAEQNGYRVLGVRDYLSEPDPVWNGLHYYIETPDGIAELNVATPELLDAQKIVSYLTDELPGGGNMISELETEQARILKELGAFDESMLSPEDAVKVARLKELEQLIPRVRDEYEAAAAIAGDAWRHPLRKMHDPDYDESVAVLDRVYNWSLQWLLPGLIRNWDKDWATKAAKAGEPGMIGPMTAHVNRAFMPMKLEVLHHFITDAKADVADLVRLGYANGDTVDDILHDVVEVLATKYPMFPAESIKEALFTWSTDDIANAFYREGARGDVSQKILDQAAGAAAERLHHPDAPPEEAYRAGMNIPLKNPDAAAIKILDKIAETIKMPILRGERHGLPADLADAWSWQTFRDVNTDMPSYYPHIRSDSGAAMWWNGRVPKRAPQTQFNKGYKGYLQETGRILDNPFEAYGRRAYQILRHEELIDQLEKMKLMGRLLSREELTEIQGHAGKMEGEVLFSPDYLTSKVRLHSELLEEIWGEMSDGDILYEDAARKAIEKLNTKLQKTTLDDLKDAKVYAIPKYVADQFQSGFLQGFAPSRMRFFWDKPRDLWMSSTLGLNPRWFIYRMMGNIIFAGVSHPTAIPRMFGWSRAKNNEIIEVLMNDTLTANGKNLLERFGQGYAAAEAQRIGLLLGKGRRKKLGLPPGSGEKFREWGSAADEFPDATRRLDIIYNARWAAPFKKVSRTITQAVNVMEQAERRGIGLSIYAKQVGKQLDSNIALARKLALEGVDEPSVAKMIEGANWTLGNYTNLSPLERDVIRRFLMPFYPFYRHMVKFALRMPWDHPMKSQVLRLINQVDEDMGPHLPDYLSGAVYLGEMGGMPTYWNITRWNPLAELTLPEFTPSMGLDFRLKTLFQALSGTDEFGRPYSANNVYEAPNGVKMIRTESGWEVFEGIQHPPWTDMLTEWYGGPGSNLVRGHLTQDKFKMPWQKAVAGNLGVTLSQYDQQSALLRELEAMQAAMSSPTAREIPVSR